MQWKTPKNTDKYQWTQHVTEKMHYYGLSEQKVLGVIRNPKRIETGIVENTVAVMMPVGNIGKKEKISKWKSSFASNEASADTWNQEIWVMYQLRNSAARNNNQETNSKQKVVIKNIENLDKEKAKKLIKLMPKKLVIISAWRYPGVSPKNNPIPEEILREIEETALA